MTTPTAAQQAQELGFGSVAELMVFNELIRRGLVHQVDFQHQSRFFGGRLDKGGLIVDFLFSNPPDLAINVQGVFFHLEQGVGQIARDKIAKAQLAGQGITLIFIDDDDILEDVEFFVGAALNYEDHSRITRGLL